MALNAATPLSVRPATQLPTLAFQHVLVAKHAKMESAYQLAVVTSIVVMVAVYQSVYPAATHLRILAPAPLVVAAHQNSVAIYSTRHIEILGLDVVIVMGYASVVSAVQRAVLHFAPILIRRVDYRFTHVPQQVNLAVEAHFAQMVWIPAVEGVLAVGIPREACVAAQTVVIRRLRV